MSKFQAALVTAFSSRQSQSLPVNELTDHVNSDPSTQFSGAEVMAALEQLQDANRVMVSEGIVFLI